MVAQSYATRHPAHPGKLVLISTIAKMEWDAIFAAFERIGGVESRRLAEAFWLSPTAENRRIYREKCHPLYYTTSARDPDAPAREIVHDAVSLHFNGPGHESMRMDFRASLSCVACPTLVMAGEDDPITPITLSEALVANLPPHLVQFERFAHCGHGVVRDAPEKHFSRLRAFMNG